MFARTVTVEWVGEDGRAKPCLLAWIDNFAMRNFTNEAIFDDTLPLCDGMMEVGRRVPVEPLEAAMTDWFLRKGYLKAGAVVKISEKSTP